MPDLPIRNGSDDHPSWHMFNACPVAYAMNTPDGLLVTSGMMDGSLTTIPDVQVAQRWTARVVEVYADEGVVEHISLVREVGLRSEPAADGPTLEYAGTAQTYPTPLGAWYSADADMPRPSDDEIRTLADLHRAVVPSPTPDADPGVPGDDAGLRGRLKLIVADAERTTKMRTDNPERYRGQLDLAFALLTERLHAALIIAQVRAPDDDPPPRKRAPKLPKVVREILDWSASSDNPTLTLLVGTDWRRELQAWIGRGYSQDGSASGPSQAQPRSSVRVAGGDALESLGLDIEGPDPLAELRAGVRALAKDIDHALDPLDWADKLRSLAGGES